MANNKPTVPKPTDSAPQAPAQRLFSEISSALQQASEQQQQLESQLNNTHPSNPGPNEPSPHTLAQQLADSLESMRDALNHYRYRSVADQHPSQNSSPTTPLNPPTGRILVVDDDLLTREITANIVTEQHYQVDRVENAQDAIREAQNRPYDLILMDCFLPDNSGFHATHNILTQASEHRPAIVGITAAPWQEYIAPAIECGMLEVLAKPLNRVILKRLLREYSPRV